MNNFLRAAAACVLAVSAAAHGAPNSLHDEFSGMSQDERGERVTKLLSSMGQMCPYVLKELPQGALPDGTALWSFTCAGHGDFQLIIFPDRDIKVLACADVAKNKSLLPCFVPVPKK
jgi:hypothetical protein